MNLKYDGYCTHLPFLSKCLSNTNGDILELGTGVYSSYLFSEYSSDTRKVYSIDTDLTYYTELKSALSNEKHEFIYVLSEDYVNFIEEYSCYDRKYSVVFIDHGIVDERVKDIERFRHYSNLIVVHDSSYTSNQNHDKVTYKYNNVIDTFKYKCEYTKLWPYTCVMSNTNDLSWL